MISRKPNFLATVLCATIAATQPSFAAENWPDSIDAYVLQVRKTIDTIDVDGFSAVVTNPGDAFLVDIRDPDEFKAAHVPGTVNVSRGRLEFRIWRPLGYPNQIDMNRKIFVLCATGARAILAAKQLRDVGFTNVTAVVMTLTDWERKGYPVTKEQAK